MMLLSASVFGYAQKRSCDLGLKVFSYDAVDSSERRVNNVNVGIIGTKSRNKAGSLINLENTTFKNLFEGKYKLEFKKAGYKTRTKTIDLDCGIAGEDNLTWNYTYLWLDSKAADADTDLVSDVGLADSEEKSKNGINNHESEKQTDETTSVKVEIKVLIDEDGNVVSATFLNGDRLFAEKAIKMARNAKFSPTLIKGVPYRVSGGLTYKFVSAL